MAAIRQRSQPAAAGRMRYPPASAFLESTSKIAPMTTMPATAPVFLHQMHPASAMHLSTAGPAAHSSVLPMHRGELPTSGQRGQRTAPGRWRPSATDLLIVFGVVCLLMGAFFGLAIFFSSGPGPGSTIPVAEHSKHRVPAETVAEVHMRAAAHARERVASGSTPTTNAERRERVRGMMELAWGGYKQHAWGANELRPVSRQGHSAQIFGNVEGATIVDALDTLILMNMTDEVAAARVWIEENLTFDIDAHVSTFEVCIRYLGGLLSAYALTEDDIYRRKAAEIGDRLLPAFDTPTGIPWSAVNLRSGKGMTWSWAPGGCAILSELGTMSLEFEYLSRITGNPVYADKARQAVALVIANVPPNGMYPNYIHPQSGQWGPYDVSVGALGDSFYEYLYKGWILAGKPQNSPLKKAYDDAIVALQPLIRTSQRGNMFIAESKNGTKHNKMGHLACFIGGLFALSAADARSVDEAERLFRSGMGITETCYRGYANSATGLGPEEMQFDTPVELSSANAGHRYYVLRPEVIESYFYMWRITKDERYRTYAWEAVEALEKHARCGARGYCGIKDVQINPPVHDDLQQSYFLAETLKYLYLIFDDGSLLPLDRWVMNTEAHPLPVLV